MNSQRRVEKIFLNSAKEASRECQAVEDQGVVAAAKKSYQELINAIEAYELAPHVLNSA